MRVFAANVVGYAPTQFTDSRTGEMVNGYNVFFTYPNSTPGSRGDSVGRCYIPGNSFAGLGLDVGESCYVGYAGGKFNYVDISGI